MKDFCPSCHEEVDYAGLCGNQDCENYKFKHLFPKAPPTALKKRLVAIDKFEAMSSKAKFIAKLLILFAFLNCELAFSYTINNVTNYVSDGSYPDTTNAYANLPALDDYNLIIGTAGSTYNWSNQFNAGNGQRLTIKGASAGNRPTIKFWNSPGVGINIGGTANKITTVKDLIIEDSASGPTFRKILVTGNGVCGRISNVKFTSLIVCCPLIGFGSINSTHIAGPYGVIDNCEWNFSSGCQMNGVFVIDNGSVDHWGWTQPMTWGATNAVYVEDCIFTTDRTPAGSIVDAFGGARIVVRYCNVTNFFFATHGRQSGANDSTLQVEAYMNNFHCNTTNGMGDIIWTRGGTCVIWSNNITISSPGLLTGGTFRFSAECACSFWASEGCGFQHMYPTDYPITQQIGRGVVGGVEGSVPAYVWDNTYPPGSLWGDAGSPQAIQRFSEGSVEPPVGDAPFILFDREIVTYAKPSYTPWTYPYSSIGTASTTKRLFLRRSGL